ncbi:MAG: hypothetical protein EBU70_01935 [Actinobacteria bacterium]|nr:hypothetical protein [Actinomycetota bacterium]
MREAFTVYEATVGFARVPELEMATAMSFDRVIRLIEHARALLANWVWAASMRWRGARPGKVIPGHDAAGNVEEVAVGTVVVEPEPVENSHVVSDWMENRSPVEIVVNAVSSTIT